MMDAVILAAGRGKRLGSLTEKIPKPLIEISGKPIIEHQISLLNGKIDKVYLVVNYKKEMITDFVESIKERYGIETSYIVQENMMGTAHAVSLLHEGISDPFLLMVGDTIFGDFPEIKKSATIFVKESDKTENKGIVEGENGKATNVFYNSSFISGSRMIDVSFLILPKKTIEYCKNQKYSGEEVQLITVLNEMIKDGQDFSVINYDSPFYHITSMKDLDRAERQILNNL